MIRITPDALVEDFCMLARIDGTPLNERKVADYIKRDLEALGVRIIEQPIPIDGSTAGNLVCIPSETDVNKPVAIVAAHMDTIQSTSLLRPVITDGRITSDGSTILGADNRAGVAAILHAFRLVREHSGLLKNIVMLFTVAEEIGMVGAQHLDVSDLPEIGRIFVFDCSRRPGIFIQHCHGCMKFRVEIHGRSAHAGVDPEKGLNAISMAAEIIHSLPQGKLENDATFNIGTIHGGEATNVVSHHVVFDGEIRGPSMEIIEWHKNKLEETTRRITELRGGRATVSTSLSFAPYDIDPSSDLFREAERIIQKSGLKPQPIRYTGGSDANAFQAMGIPAVNFGIGAQQPHSHEEFILIEDLISTTKLVLNAISLE